MYCDYRVGREPSTLVSVPFAGAPFDDWEWLVRRPHEKSELIELGPVLWKLRVGSWTSLVTTKKGKKRNRKQ